MTSYRPALLPPLAPGAILPDALSPAPEAATRRPAAAPARAVQGELQLRFRLAAHTQTAVTVVDTLVQTPPLRIVQPFALPDGAALVHLHNLSGGILGGDRLRTTLDVAPGARAQVTTTGATRIYRRRHDQGPAQQETVVHVVSPAR